MAAIRSAHDYVGMGGEDAAGPVKGRRRGAGWTSVSHGLHVPAGAGSTEHLRAWQLLLPPHGCFTHVTGAAICGWWLPPLLDGMPVVVALKPRDVRPTRDGIRSLRIEAAAKHEVVDGLRVSGPAERLLACARDLGLIDLVVLIDGALAAGDITLEELTEAANARRRGAPALRRAIPWAHPKSESAWETVLRIFHRACDIEVEPQHEVYNEHGGLVARGDLWLVGTRTFHEYDGDDHLARRRQVKDLRRVRRLDAEDWARRGYTSEDVITRPIGILRDADRTLGRVHDPERIKAWYALLRESCFTPAGRRRLAERLGIDRAA